MVRKETTHSPIDKLYNILQYLLQNAGGYSEPSQTCKIELFTKIVNSWKLLTISARNFILNVWGGSEYASGMLVSIWKKKETLA